MSSEKRWPFCLGLNVLSPSLQQDVGDDLRIDNPMNAQINILQSC